MAIVKRLKKQGIARWTIKGATSGDYFTVPRGFKLIDALIVENGNTPLSGTGTLSLGKVPGVNAVYSMTITGAITTASQNWTWAGGIISTTAQITTAQLTAITGLVGGATGALQLAATAALIVSMTPTLTGTAGNVAQWALSSVGPVIYITGMVPGAGSSAPTFAVGSTGITVSSSTAASVTTGSVDTTYMNPSYVPALTPTSVSLLPFNYTLAPIVPTPYPYQTVTWIGTVGGSTTTITIDGVACTTVQGHTAAQVAADIASSYSGAGSSGQTWTVTQVGSSATNIFIGNKATYAPPLQPSITYGSITGVTTTGTTVTNGTLTYPPTIISSPVAATPLTNGSYAGAQLLATYSTTAGGAGSYNLCGQTVSIPSGLTAPNTGFWMGGRSYYQFTATYVSGGAFTINGVSITAATNSATTAAAIASAVIPGWMVVVPGASNVVYMYATRSGPMPLPVFGAGYTAYLTIGTIVSQLGFTIPGYVNDSLTPITATTTFTSTAGANGTYAINGTAVNILNTMTASQIAQVFAGCAYYYFTVTSGTAGTNYINGALFTAAASGATTATNLGNLVNVPGKSGDAGGWTIVTQASTIVLMIAQNPGYMSQPTFSAGAVAAPVIAGGAVFQQGFTLAGYTSMYNTSTTTGSTSWTGPAPVFTALAPPTTTTYATLYSLVGTTGVNYIYADYVNNPGAQPPTLAPIVVPTSQTVAQVALPADLNYYLNFSNPAMHGNVNVTAIMLKYN
jgi:collagen type VII alpha